MSIYAYTGMPGSGKSYDVVENQVLPSLKAGRHVVTNIPLNLEALRDVVPDGKVTEFPTAQVQASPELMSQWALPGCVLILDEVWKLWPAGLKAHQVPEVYKSLLAEHRHMVDEAGNAMQIVLVTQDLAQISAFARQLVETTFHHTKLTHVGAEGSFRVDVYNGPMAGPNPPQAARLRSVFGRYDPAIWKLYKSHTMSRAEGAGANERTLDRRANVWHRPMIYVGLAFVVAAVVWGVPHLRKSFSPSAPAAHSSAPSSGPAVAPPRGGGQVVTAVVSAWRVAGVMRFSEPSRDVAMLTDGEWAVTVPYAAFCRQLAGVGTECTWEGQVARDWWPVKPAQLQQ